MSKTTFAMCMVSLVGCAAEDQLVEQTQEGLVSSCTATPSTLAGAQSQDFHPDWDHQIFFNTTVDKHKLMVFLPGHGAHPSGYTDYLKHVAGLGFHVIGLSYWNIINIPSMCGADMSCYGALRREIFDFTKSSNTHEEINWILGHDTANDCGKSIFGAGQTSASSSISLHDGVRNRLLVLLRGLIQSGSFCGSGWSEFLIDPSCVNGDLTTCNFDWSKIVIAGHSQGSGMAGFIGALRQPLRTVMFSGPADANTNGAGTVVADWVTHQPSTFFGLADVGDTANGDCTGARIDRIRADWFLLGMPFSFTNQIDSNAPPYGNSRQLFTNQGGGDVGAAHNRTAANWSGRPATTVAAWDYMLSGL